MQVKYSSIYQLNITTSKHINSIAHTNVSLWGAILVVHKTYQGEIKWEDQLTKDFSEHLRQAAKKLK